MQLVFATTAVVQHTDKKRKQSGAMFDDARPAARQTIHAASSLPDDDVEGNVLLLMR